MQEKAKLRRELIVKKLEARVAAVIVAATMPVAVSQRRLTKEDNITGEDLPEVMIITLRFAGLS